MSKGKGYLVGSPVPIGRLPMRPAPTKYPWMEILRSIPVGYAQEVKLSFHTCTAALRRLFRLGKIKKGEYIVRTRENLGKNERSTLSTKANPRHPHKHKRPNRKLPKKVMDHWFAREASIHSNTRVFRIWQWKI